MPTAARRHFDQRPGEPGIPTGFKLYHSYVVYDKWLCALTGPNAAFNRRPSLALTVQLEEWGLFEHH